MDPSVVRRLWRARDFIYTEFRSSPSLSSVAAEANFSPFHFHRLYRSVFTETPNEYLIRRRMEEAARMIVETDATILEVVLAVGYESPATFAERFRRFTGVAPSEYRARHRRALWHVDLRHLMVPACFIRRRA
jgi:AraC family transcriptional regulator